MLKMFYFRESWGGMVKSLHLPLQLYRCLKVRVLPTSASKTFSPVESISSKKDALTGEMLEFVAIWACNFNITPVPSNCQNNSERVLRARETENVEGGLSMTKTNYINSIRWCEVLGLKAWRHHTFPLLIPGVSSEACSLYLSPSLYISILGVEFLGGLDFAVSKVPRWSIFSCRDRVFQNSSFGNAYESCPNMTSKPSKCLGGPCMLRNMNRPSRNLLRAYESQSTPERPNTRGGTRLEVFEAP